MARCSVATTRALGIWYGLFVSIVALDNGVARQPPMGWTSWVRFGCNLLCNTDPNNCISELLYKQMADHMVRDGFLDAGYDIVGIDDCWMSLSRDSDNRLQADPTRFPSGIKHLADYMHDRGLRLSIYADVGTHTCAMYPGSRDFMQLDAETFAEWGVDMIKFDGCNANTTEYDTGFPAMGVYLNQTGRPIIYSCEWPMYARYFGGTVDYSIISNTCNVFRALTDVYDSFYSVLSMVDYFAADFYNMSRYARPGAWNDPDQLVIGNFGLSINEERLQMALWSMWSAPLIMSNDLRRLSPASKAILLNRDVIALNQDDLGVQARLVWQMWPLSAWAKPLNRPRPGSAAIVFINRAITGGPTATNFTLSSLLTSKNFPVVFSGDNRNSARIVYNASSYHVTELFDKDYRGQFALTTTIRADINPNGVYLIRVVPVTDDDFTDCS